MWGCPHLLQPGVVHHRGAVHQLLTGRGARGHHFLGIGCTAEWLLDEHMLASPASLDDPDFFESGRYRDVDHLHLAVGETVILLYPPLPLVGVSIGTKRGRQKNDSLADGYFHRLVEEQLFIAPKELAVRNRRGVLHLGNTGTVILLTPPLLSY